MLTKARNNPIIYLAAKVWEHARGNRRNIVIYVSLFVGANAMNLVQPLVVAYVLNIIQAQGVTTANLSFILGVLLLLPVSEVAFWAFHFPGRVLETSNAFITRAAYKKSLIEGVMTLPAEWHTDHHSGDTIDKIEKGAAALYNYCTNTFRLVQGLTQLAGSFAALVYFNIHAGYIVLMTVAATLTLIVQFDKVLVRQYRDLFLAENAISAKVYDAISNIATVIILRIERLVAKSIYQSITHPFALYRRNRKLNEVKWFFTAASAWVMTFFVLASYLYFHLRAGTPILAGTIFALFGYIQKINGIFYNFAYLYSDMAQQKSAVLNAEELSREFRKVKYLPQVELGRRWKELRIEHLSFSYHGKEGDLHLEEVSMAIRRGERIALIGESGSGKTTFLKVIRELYPPRQLRLYLDGLLLKNGFRAISSNIALIPQDPEIFNTTIRENITVGVSHELSYIRKFTDMACFSDVVERLPKKFESSIMEKGVNLSEGEKQRLALARGLMACEDKSIVLLDEPTSSVDTKNELTIYRNIFQAFKEKTIIASIHRLHLLGMFDRVFFFRGGRLIAAGTLDQVLESSAAFQELWKKYHVARETERGEA